jgi:hypothetical protein
MVGRWIIYIALLALAIFAIYLTLSLGAVHDNGLLERLASKIERAMSPDAFVTLLDQYALFAIGMLVVFAAGLFLWKKLRKIEVRLDNLRGEVNQLRLIEARRFLVALNSGASPGAEIERAEPSNSSIVPDIADIHSEDTRLAVADSANISRDGDRPVK